MSGKNSPILPRSKLDLRAQLWPPKAAPESGAQILERFQTERV